MEEPEKILALHRAYLDAGSQIILTNTFGGSSIKLKKFGLSERTSELNHAAARLARQISAGKAFIAGDIGPTGELMRPMGPLTFEEARASFLEQAMGACRGRRRCDLD